ncbi:uncharacterized protein I303_105377 [Kwoniella dejecticola CBS 10117]|uniref:Uncharacterized protein n=1 Tax=Kwoniella dejecticola CBS 10117 TaxID=1296121 RepID=A0AAJ8KSP5_9TREE
MAEGWSRGWTATDTGGQSIVLFIQWAEARAGDGREIDRGAGRRGEEKGQGEGKRKATEGGGKGDGETNGRMMRLGGGERAGGWEDGRTRAEGKDKLVNTIQK